MNILFLAHRIPYPPDKGDKIRSFNMLKYLSEKNKIFLGAVLDEKDEKTLRKRTTELLQRSFHCLH